MRRRGGPWPPWTRIAAAMAMIAVGVRLLVPVGLMLDRPVQAGALPALVICTGHGALTVSGDQLADPRSDLAPHPGNKSPHDSPCAFAASGAASAPPISCPHLIAWNEHRASAALPPAADQLPGRGLPAPPPPARGPPTALTS